MAKRAALPLEYSRIKDILPDVELIRLAEKVKGKALKPKQKEQRKELVDNILMREISVFASCMWGKGYEMWYDHNLYRAVQKTAEILNLGTKDEIKILSNEEVCEKIQSILDVKDSERILHLSEEERILTLRSITPQFSEIPLPVSDDLPKDYESSYGQNPGSFYNPLSFSNIVITAAAPAAGELIKQGGELAGQAIRSGDTAKFLAMGAPLIKEKLGKQALKVGKDVLKGGAIAIAVTVAVTTALGVYLLAEEKREKKERDMVDVICTLIACLCFNPYAVLNLEPDSTFEVLRRAYITEVYKIHPDRIIGLPAEQQTFAYQRMKEITLAWEIIQTEKGFNS